MKCVVAFYINSVENNMKNDYVTKNDTTTTTATKKMMFGIQTRS